MDAAAAVAAGRLIAWLRYWVSSSCRWRQQLAWLIVRISMGESIDYGWAGYIRNVLFWWPGNALVKYYFYLLERAHLQHQRVASAAKRKLLTSPWCMRFSLQFPYTHTYTHTRTHMRLQFSFYIFFGNVGKTRFSSLWPWNQYAFDANSLQVSKLPQLCIRSVAETSTQTL